MLALSSTKGAPHSRKCVYTDFTSDNLETFRTFSGVKRYSSSKIAAGIYFHRRTLKQLLKIGKK